MSKLILGVGCTDISAVDCDGKVLRSYTIWKAIIERCYSDVIHRKNNTYKNCSVDISWAFYSNFKKFYDENYREGYEIDKDIITPGNKVYSPEHCRFVPPLINRLAFRLSSKGYVESAGKFRAYINIKGKRKFLGSFLNSKDAHSAYACARELYIKKVAAKYYNDQLIGIDVYEALMNIKIKKG